MADGNAPVPEQETRGGDRIDWGKTEPGKPLKQKPEPQPESQVPSGTAPGDPE